MTWHATPVQDRRLTEHVLDHTATNQVPIPLAFRASVVAAPSRLAVTYPSQDETPPSPALPLGSCYPTPDNKTFAECNRYPNFKPFPINLLNFNKLPEYSTQKINRTCHQSINH